MAKSDKNNYLNGNGLKSTDHFLSPNGDLFAITQMIDSIKSFIEEDANSFYQLVIGSDSQLRVVNKHEETDYVSAVIVYKKGKGARYFWRKVKIDKKPNLRDKIYMETLMSLDLAQKLVPEIRNRISSNKYDLQIHIDVGPIGPTREMIKEVVGMVNGNGFIAKTKPDSWGASSVADKHT